MEKQEEQPIQNSEEKLETDIKKLNDIEPIEKIQPSHKVNQNFDKKKPYHQIKGHFHNYHQNHNNTYSSYSNQNIIGKNRTNSEKYNRGRFPASNYAKTSYIFTPQMKRYDEFMYFKNMKWNHFKVQGNVLGNPDGKVVVYEYSDFECPWCKIMNRMIQKAATEYENVYVVHYNFPLDINCNPVLKRQIHNNSCK